MLASYIFFQHLRLSNLYRCNLNENKNKGKQTYHFDNPGQVSDTVCSNLFNFLKKVVFIEKKKELLHIKYILLTGNFHKILAE